MIDLNKYRHADCGTLDGQLILDSQDLEPIVDYVGANLLDITGAIVLVEDGEYSEVWLTQSSAPYHIHAIYFQVR